MRASYIFRLWPAWLAAGAWLGCNQILGNESAVFDPTAADGGSADGSGEGGANGDGGSKDGESGDGSLDGGDADTNPCVDIATNSRHCGACNHDCRGGACVDGGCQPIVLATDLPGPDAIVVDATHLYWVNMNTNSIWTVPIDGGAKELLFEGPDAGFPGTSLALHAGNLYFGSGDLDASVMRCATPHCDGGAAVEVANRDAPTSVFVTADGTLFLTQSSSPGSVEKCALPCTLGTAIITNGAGEQFPANIAVGADGTVFWTRSNPFPGRLVELAPASAPAPIATGPFRAVTPAAGEVYFVDEGKGPAAVPLDGGSPRYLRDVPTVGYHIAVDTKVVYASQNQDDYVYACDRVAGCGDAGTVLAKVQSAPRGITFDNTFIFWANGGNVGTGGKIMRLAK